MSSPPIRIEGRRLWDSLMMMAAIGATAAGGCNRLALTQDDKASRDLFKRWCEEAGCAVRIDQIGNIFARRAGAQDGAPAVMAGSHLDTQPTGGKFDGVYGVLAALEVIRTLNDCRVQTECPVEAVVWSNEEGARFSPAMLGSGVWAGAHDLSYAHARTDRSQITFREALKEIGYLGEHACVASPVRASFEAHIEQGPVLERGGQTIGVVYGVQGVRWLEITIEGKSSHAGSTPMDMRHDPVVALGEIITRLFQLAALHAPSVRLTMGRIEAEPGAYNTVPSRVRASVDLRNPDEDTLRTLTAAVGDIVRNACQTHRVEGRVRSDLECAPVRFSAHCVDAVQRAADHLGYRSLRMLSGAAHDSMHIARVAPSAMIFVPCKGGVSHNPEEDATPQDLEAGCNVLLHAVLEMARL